MKNETNSVIRVLIVDDIPETRENLRKLLYFEPDIEVVGTATGGQEAVKMARELRPDIALMDINMPGLDGITASEMIARESPYTQIIMMSVQGEADYLRRSMLAGAREFLIKPFSSDELVSSIRRVYELGASRRTAMAEALPATAIPGVAVSEKAPKPADGKIIAVYAPKGGVGCSTIAANVAVALQELSRNEKVVLVDANLQFGGIEVLLNLQSQRTIVDLAEKIEDMDSELINSVVSSHTSGIKVLLAPPRPEMADLVTSTHMSKILEELKRNFDFIVVDTRSALLDLELAIMDMATRILLITTAEIPSIKNAKLFFDIASVLQYPPEKTILIVNEADRRGGIRAEDIEASIRHPVTATIPLDERIASVAVNQGVPLVLTYRNSAIAQSIMDLARRLLVVLQPVPEAQAEPQKAASLLGKLFR